VAAEQLYPPAEVGLGLISLVGRAVRPIGTEVNWHRLCPVSIRDSTQSAQSGTQSAQRKRTRNIPGINSSLRALRPLCALCVESPGLNTDTGLSGDPRQLSIVSLSPAKTWIAR